MKKIFLSTPAMGDMEHVFALEALEIDSNGNWNNNVNYFENDISRFFKLKVSTSALSSGTAALHLANILLGVSMGDEVICQSFTYSATVNPIFYEKAIPVFVDSEKETWNMNPLFLEEAIKDRLSKGKKLAAIIVVDLYGMPAKLNEIVDIANKYNIPVIEDAAEALGSHINGKKCGSYGKLNVLSFNRNKIITTNGGGALLSDDEEMINTSRFLATQAKDDAPHYQHSHIGYNYRMSNVLAGIGRGQMIVLPERIKQRRNNFLRYKMYFKELENKGYHIEFQEEPNGFYSNRWLTTIYINPVLNRGISRESLRLALEKEYIESRPLWKPMHLQPIFNSSAFYGDGTSEDLFNNGLCLPSDSNLTDQDFERIFAVMDRLFC